EAIRPTYFTSRTVEGTSNEKRLYDLIWKRAVASQMSDAIIERTTVGINISGSDKKFIAKGEVIKFDGFIKLYTETLSDDATKDEEGLLPEMHEDQELKIKSIESTERFEQRPARYSEAALVKQLEELGIGRPSTYAPTITTIISRGYVSKEDREGTERSYQTLLLTKGEIKDKTLTVKHGSD
ncbi:MAG: DNA topoisomerase, partial [Rikenellaceae bacterium]